MNDISVNPYINCRKHHFRDYSICDFLYKEIAVERVTTLGNIMLVMNDILALHKFNVHFLGFKFLASLSARYVVKHDYEQSAAIDTIADNYGTSSEYVCNCIRDSIDSNTEFLTIATKTLSQPLRLTDKNKISDAVLIIGAIFKIYYNYKVCDEEFEFDSQYVVNFNRL